MPGKELGLPGSPTALEAGLYHAVDLRKVRYGAGGNYVIPLLATLYPNASHSCGNASALTAALR